MGIKLTPWLILSLACLGGAGCSSLFSNNQFKQKSAAMGCPPAQIEKITNTRARLGLIQVGVTPVRALKFLGKPNRTLTLARADQADLQVDFYPLGLETCRWVADSPNYLPVISQTSGEKLVLGHGLETLMTLHKQGWELGTRKGSGRLFAVGPQAHFVPTPWPWQSYGYAYLPRN